MVKTLFAAAVAAVAFTAPAFADDMMCDDASMMKIDDMIMADTNSAMKEDVEMAKKEMDMAKMAMKDGKADDCMMHMENAKKAMMME